jgi:hypothetical protein
MSHYINNDIRMKREHINKLVNLFLNNAIYMLSDLILKKTRDIIVFFI